MSRPDAAQTVAGKVRPIAARAAHSARRVAQTPRAFANWPALLGDIARGRPEELTFRTRTGQSLTCPNVPGARVPIYEIYAEDAYRLVRFLGPLRDEPLRVLDIGAHVGAFACRLAQLAPRARIECFEPSAATAQYLRRNLAANHIDGRVTVAEVAVAAAAGTARFADNGAGSALNGLVAGTDGVEVRTAGFDDIAAGGDRPVDLVKIDCEGGEYDLVLGSRAASWASVRRVVLEYHPSTRSDWPALREWFAAAGLDVVESTQVSAQQGTAWLARDAVRP